MTKDYNSDYNYEVGAFLMKFSALYVYVLIVAFQLVSDLVRKSNI